MNGRGPLGLGTGQRRPFRLERPVAAMMQFAARVHRQRRTRRKFADTCVNRARCRHHGVQGEQMMQRDCVETGVHPARRQQRLRRGGEAETARRFVVVQRLDAQTVAREEQRVAVPDREGEHAVQALDTGFAPFKVRPQNDLGVAVGAEGMAERDQLGAQLGVVVDRAVEHQRGAGRGIQHGLRGFFGKIDDRQPPVAQPHRAVAMLAFRIRSAPRQLRQHARHRRRVGRCLVEPEFTCNATHVFNPATPPAAARPSARSARAIRGCAPASTAAY